MNIPIACDNIKEKKFDRKVTMETSCTQKQLGGGCLMYRRITCERALQSINAAEGWRDSDHFTM